MKFSLIISTRGRTEELTRLFDSLAAQTLQDFQAILADQNDDNRLADILEESPLGDKLIRLNSSGGLSRGRNEGLTLASGEILGFPDDDCVYPPTLLQEVAQFFAAHPEYGFLSGRSYADDGGDSVSRHAKHASEIEKATVHAQCIEFALFVRRSALGATRFDEQMGVGAPTPWHSDEGPDLLLRLKEKNVRGFYDPQFGVWHARPVTSFNAKDIDRTYRYACGNGYFYRKHQYPLSYFAYQMFRSLGGLLMAVGTLKKGKALLYLARLRGRLRGWRSQPKSISTS